MQVKHDSSSTDWWLGKLLESRSWDVVRGSRFRGLGKEKELKEKQKRIEGEELGKCEILYSCKNLITR